jgi:hypothetical protein
MILLVYSRRNMLAIFLSMFASRYQNKSQNLQLSLRKSLDIDISKHKDAPRKHYTWLHNMKNLEYIFEIK